MFLIIAISVLAFEGITRSWIVNSPLFHRNRFRDVKVFCSSLIPRKDGTENGRRRRRMLIASRPSSTRGWCSMQNVILCRIMNT